MGRVQDLVDGVLSEGGFDATPAQALRWLSARHGRMVVRARCFRKTVSVGPTVALQQEYALPPELRGIFSVAVAGVPYGEARHGDIAAQAQSRLWLCGTGGVVTGEEDTDGLGTLALIPPPGAGLDVTVRGFFWPSALLTADDTTLKTPEEYDDPLIAGGIATGYRRLLARPDLAGPFETDYANGCEELRLDTKRRYKQQGPAQIRLA